jgi:hypothetical protein
MISNLERGLALSAGTAAAMAGGALMRSLTHNDWYGYGGAIITGGLMYWIIFGMFIARNKR